MSADIKRMCDYLKRYIPANVKYPVLLYNNSEWLETLCLMIEAGSQKYKIDKEKLIVFIEEAYQKTFVYQDPEMNLYSLILSSNNFHDMGAKASDDENIKLPVPENNEDVDEDSKMSLEDMVKDIDTEEGVFEEDD